MMATRTGDTGLLDDGEDTLLRVWVVVDADDDVAIVAAGMQSAVESGTFHWRDRGSAPAQRHV